MEQDNCETNCLAPGESGEQKCFDSDGDGKNDICVNGNGECEYNCVEGEGVDQKCVKNCGGTGKDCKTNCYNENDKCYKECDVDHNGDCDHDCHNPDGTCRKKCTDGNGKCTDKCEEGGSDIKALMTVVSARDVNLDVTIYDMLKEGYGDNSYRDVRSKEPGSLKVSLDSQADTTSCHYNIMYKVEKNNFEKRYPNDGELFIEMVGFDNNGKEKTHLIDITDKKDNETGILVSDTLIENDAKKEEATVQEWKINLIFRNYQTHDQTYNAGKTAKIKIQLEGSAACERIY